MQKHKPFPQPEQPFDPAQRAKAIRDAIKQRKIKRTKEIDEILIVLDEMVALEKTA